MKRLMLVLLLAGAARAEVFDGLAVIDRGDTVEIIARGAFAVPETHAAPQGDRLEIPLVVPPDAVVSAHSNDPTVKKVELMGGDNPRLSVQLRHGRDTTAKIAAVAEIVQAEGGIRVTLVRSGALKTYKPPVAAAAVAAPVPAPVAAPVPAPAAVAAAVPAPAAVAAPAAVPAPVAAPTQPDPSPATIAGLQKPSSDFGLGRASALVLGLGACGALVLIARRKKKNAATDIIRVIASQSLGGKHKVVLVAAGRREFLLSLSDKGTRVIGRWRSRADEAAVSQPVGEFGSIEFGAEPPTRVRPRLDPPSETPVTLPPASPAVAGLLKLRRGERALGTGDSGEWAEKLVRARSKA